MLPKRLLIRARWLVAAAVLPLAASSLVAPAESSPVSQPAVGQSATAAPKRVVFIVLDQLAAGVHRRVRHGERQGADGRRRLLPERLARPHGVRDRGQPQRDDQRHAAKAHGLGRRVVPRHRRRARRRTNAQYVTGSMGQPQFDALIQDKGYPKLADYLHAKFPGTIVASIGQKNYAMYAMSGPGADIRVTFGGRSFDCDGDATVDNTWRGPVGVNVPTYITEATVAPACPEDDHFYVDSDSDLNYGTLTTSPAWMYPLQGNRDISGPDADHPGGDVWATDAAFEVMDHEDWSGLLLTLGGIDKAGHMWGGLNDVPPYPAGAEDPLSHMANAAKVADEQVGRDHRQARGRRHCSTRPSSCSPPTTRS